MLIKQQFKMTNFLKIVLSVSIVLISCTSNGQQRKSGSPKNPTSIKHTGSDTINRVSYFTFDKDSVTVLPFDIGIVLSLKAKAKIVSSKETIIVNVSLTGTPKNKKLIAEDGDFYVASAEKEITYGQIARFNDIKFSRKMYDQLTDKDVSVNVFFYSGRKSSKDNLLSGNILSNKISNIVRKKFELTGKLIYGDD